jgi:site-specific recombinase XerD
LFALQNALIAFLLDVRARGLSTSTYRRYHDDVRELCHFFATRSWTTIHTVTPQMLRSYFDFLQRRENGRHHGTRLSPFTIEGRYRSIQTFFNWCTEERLCPANPMERIDKPRVPKRIVNRLSEDQVVALLRAIQETKSPARNLALVLLLVDSGLRRGEALGLEISAIDFREHRVRVLGKGAKERDVPIGRATSQALRKWLRVRPATESPRVFVNADGSPWHADGVRSLFNRLRLRLGVPRLYPHQLRHSFAALFLKNGDVKALQQILGHSRASTTLDLYLEWNFHDLQRIHRKASPVDHIQRKR